MRLPYMLNSISEEIVVRYLSIKVKLTHYEHGYRIKDHLKKAFQFLLSAP